MFIFLPSKGGKPFSVYETLGDHARTHIISMLVKDTSHNNNELRLQQEESHICSNILISCFRMVIECHGISSFIII